LQLNAIFLIANKPTNTSDIGIFALNLSNFKQFQAISSNFKQFQAISSNYLVTNFKAG
jgi:hypothetical protein